MIVKWILLTSYERVEPIALDKHISESVFNFFCFCLDTFLRKMESFVLCVSKSADPMTSVSTPVGWMKRGPEPDSLLKVRFITFDSVGTIRLLCSCSG